MPDEARGTYLCLFFASDGALTFYVILFLFSGSALLQDVLVKVQAACFEGSLPLWTGIIMSG